MRLTVTTSPTSWQTTPSPPVLPLTPSPSPLQPYSIEVSLTWAQSASTAVPAAPSSRCHAADFPSDGSDVHAFNSYNFTNVLANHTIAASFAINTFTVTASAVLNRSISHLGAVSVNSGASRAVIPMPRC